MNHTLKSILAVIVLFGILLVVGLIVSREGGLTGATTVGSIACYNDQDCDDKTEGTTDVCKNPGTKDSLCFNRPKN